MTMLRLNRSQRSLLAETLKDAANIAAGALIFGQALSERGFSVMFALLGIGTWMLLVALGIACAGREEKQ